MREEKGWIGLETSEGVLWIQPEEIKLVRRAAKPKPAPAKDGEADGGTGKGTDAGGSEDGGRTGTGDKPGTSGEAKPGPAPQGADAAQPDADAVEIARMIEALGAHDRTRRVAAADWIASTWPRWKTALEAALATENPDVRLEAVRILDREELAEAHELLVKPLSDRSVAVRVAALRVVRHRGHQQYEPQALDAMRSAQATAVRYEAIRTLEDIGTAACLPDVLAAWVREEDPDVRRRYRRVLQRIVGDTLGDDEDAWRQAVDDVRTGRREVADRRKRR
mgnify:FL=1